MQKAFWRYTLTGWFKSMARNSKRRHAVQRAVTNNGLLSEEMYKRTSFSYTFENQKENSQICLSYSAYLSSHQREESLFQSLSLFAQYNHHHHHHWHNSPFWAKAFFRSFCQLSLFLAAFIQFLSPNFLASSITPSSHLSFGLPLCLLPSTYFL